MRLRSICLPLLAICLTTNCTDELTSTYSKKYPVRCDLMCSQYTELFNVMGNFGQFASIRRSGAKLTIKNASTSTSYNITAEQGRYFMLGLGGLIVGTNYEGEPRAYDLACPNCDLADHRLNIASDGTATCSSANCHIRYDINHDGVIMERPSECVHTSPRGLYRYQITYDGTYMRVFN